MSHHSQEQQHEQCELRRKGRGRRKCEWIEQFVLMGLISATGNSSFGVHFENCPPATISLLAGCVTMSETITRWRYWNEQQLITVTPILTIIVEARTLLLYNSCRPVLPVLHSLIPQRPLQCDFNLPAERFLNLITFHYFRSSSAFAHDDDESEGMRKGSEWNGQPEQYRHQPCHFHPPSIP